jgi:predicted Zn-dependent protease
LAEARNVDELAFVMGHETAHHIRRHLARQRESATGGAILGGILAAGLGVPTDLGTRLGGTIGARAYSKSNELEADALGTVISKKAGYNPVRGAQFFTRIPDPGDRFLGTHPPNAARVETVRRVNAGL